MTFDPKYLTALGLVGLAVFQASTSHFTDAVQTMIGAAVVLGWIQHTQQVNRQLMMLDHRQTAAMLAKGTP